MYSALKQVLFCCGRNRWISFNQRCTIITVTTPIFYCNASPHIGHLYTVVIADALKRFYELLGERCILVSGTDEHGTKILQAAASKKMAPSQFCDKISLEYQDLFNQSEISYTHFIRTTDEYHINAVHNFWRRLSDRGYIYSGKYSGWYCIADEAFLTDLQVKDVVDPKCCSKTIKVSVDSGHPVEWTVEENYLFNLSSLQDNILYWLRKEDVIKPKIFHNIVLKWVLEQKFEDLSISRPTVRVPWGISVPDNNDQTIYVWLDALVNYLTAAGYSNKPSFENHWPPTIQVLGKDILKFHAIYWPAFLIAAGLELPRQLLVHSHWTVNSEKMSKSRGNVVSPPSPTNGGTLSELNAMRYFLLRTGTLHKDNNFSDALMTEEVNADLAGSLGNLLSRCSGEILNPWQVYPPLPEKIPECRECANLMSSVESLAESIEHHYRSGNFYMGIVYIMQTISRANEFFTAMEPWKFAKDEKSMDQQLATIHMTMEALRVCGIALQPIIPSIAATLLSRLGVPADERKWHHIQCISWNGGSSSKGYQLGLGFIKLFEKIGEGVKPKVSSESVQKQVKSG